jgi:hypothetical protein
MYFPNFSYKFINPNEFFQFESGLFYCISSGEPPGISLKKLV